MPKPLTDVLNAVELLAANRAIKELEAENERLERENAALREREALLVEFARWRLTTAPAPATATAKEAIESEPRSE